MNERIFMLKYIVLLMTGLLLCAMMAIPILTLKAYHDRTSDDFARNHIVQLYGNQVLCTGIEVQSPSGKIYTLTAAHCKNMVVDNHAFFQNEQNESGSIQVIDVDDRLDLMLMEGAKSTGFRIAPGIYVYEPVHTMSHGLGMPAYRTDGIILKESAIVDPNPFAPQRMIANAPVVPGSSGGPLLDAKNNLVGVIDAYNSRYPLFSYHVTLSDINSFLKDR